MTNNLKGVIIMPLTMANTGEDLLIKKILGRDETKNFLETLGFVIGGIVTVLSENNGNVIVMVKNSRVAIDKSMANRIMV
jgi:ferrous iron transport protein A